MAKFGNTKNGEIFKDIASRNFMKLSKNVNVVNLCIT